jgi:hypothetical protein
MSRDSRGRRVIKNRFAILFLFLYAALCSGQTLWDWKNPDPTGNNLTCVAPGNGTFVAVGYTGTIIHSPDGVNWSNVTIGRPFTLHSVAFGNNLFVAVGIQVVLTSTNGATWAIQTMDDVGQIESVAFGNGIFVAVSYDGFILTAMGY